MRGLADFALLAAMLSGAVAVPPFPTPLQRGAVTTTIEGMVIVQNPYSADQQVRVRLEGPSQEMITTAVADESGRFALRNVTLDGGNVYYLVVEAEGYQTFRDRLDRQFDARSGGRVTIVLNPATSLGPSTSSDAEASVVDLRQLARNIPDEAADEYGRGLEAFAAEMTDLSIGHFEEAVRLAPEYAEAWNHLGRARLAQGDVEQAATAFQAAHDVNPTWVIPLINLGVLHYQRGEGAGLEGADSGSVGAHSTAAVVLEEAVRVDPLSALARSMLGAALYRTGDLVRAESMLVVSLELNPDTPASLLTLVNVYNRMGRHADALNTVDTFLARFPESGEAGALARVRQQLEAVIGGGR